MCQKASKALLMRLFISVSRKQSQDIVEPRGELAHYSEWKTIGLETGGSKRLNNELCHNFSFLNIDLKNKALVG